MKCSRVPVVRTPSKLYHHVFTSTPITDGRLDNDSTVGPEFVVRSRDPPKEVKLKTASTEKIKNLRTVVVILLSGQRIKLQCNPLITTLEQVFQTIINDQQIKFSHFLSLAFVCKGEFHFPDPKTKIYKIAPKGWDNNKNIVMVQTFTLYLRFLCYPRIENPHYLPSNFINMLYLQLRHDFIEGRIHVSMPTMFSLAALTLQVEFGNINKEQSEGYFLMEHYLPEVHNGNENKQTAMEKELSLLHQSLKLSPDMAKAQYISRIHGTLSYGSIIYQFVEEKQRKLRFLVISTDGLKILLEPPSFEMLLQADLLPWHVIKKFDDHISAQRLTIISSNKSKIKKLKMCIPDNRYKYVMNVCNKLKRWQQKQLGIATAYFENSINTATQKNLIKSNSEINLYQSNSIARLPESTPLLQNCDNEKIISCQKNGISSSCINLTDNSYFPRRRLNSAYSTDQCNNPRDLISFAETTEYADSSGNSCIMKTPKQNVVTYFPSEVDCSLVKTSNASPAHINLTDAQPKNTISETTSSYAITNKDIPSTNDTFKDGNTVQESLARLECSLQNSAVNKEYLNSSGANRSLFTKNEKCLTSAIKSPNNSANEKPLKRSATTTNEGLRTIERKKSTIIKVTSFRECSGSSEFSNDVLIRKNFRLKSTDLEDFADTNLSPYSSPKKSSIGVKMGTKVTTAYLQKYKQPRSGQSSYSEDHHNPIVIEPFAANVASPVRGPEESINESLVDRFLAIPSPDCGLAERKLITVSLTRKEGSLGITIQQAIDGALYVCDLTKDSPAFNDCILKRGDRLMGVNGFSVENLSCERALSLLKSSLDPVQLLVSQPIQDSNFDSLNDTPIKDNKLFEKHITVIKVSNEPSSYDYLSVSSLSPSEPISI